MKRSIFNYVILSLILLLISSTSMSADAQVIVPHKTSAPQTQTKPVERESIFDHLEAPREGQGTIRIIQSPAIQALVKQRTNSAKSGDMSQGYTVRRGYKVQVYSGNATNSKAVAQQRAGQVQVSFPEVETDLTYKAPFWRVRAGNFVSREEAQEFLRELKKAFPKFGKEMFIVSANVKVPL